MCGDSTNLPSLYYKKMAFNWEFERMVDEEKKHHFLAWMMSFLFVRRKAANGWRMLLGCWSFVSGISQRFVHVLVAHQLLPSNRVIGANSKVGCLKELCTASS